MYGFEESQATRRQELTTNKTEKGTFFVRIKLKDLFGFADQENITYGLGYTLTLKRNNNNDPIIRDNGVDAYERHLLVYSTLHTINGKPTTRDGSNIRQRPK